MKNSKWLRLQSQPCWKTAHQPQRRTGIGLTDFHGDSNHAKMSCKLDTYNVQWSIRQAIMIKTGRLGSDCRLDRMVQSITGDDLINQNEVRTVGFQ